LPSPSRGKDSERIQTTCGIRGEGEGHTVPFPAFLRPLRVACFRGRLSSMELENSLSDSAARPVERQPAGMAASDASGAPSGSLRSRDPAQNQATNRYSIAAVP